MEKWEEKFITVWLPKNIKTDKKTMKSYILMKDLLNIATDTNKFQKMTKLLEEYGIEVVSDQKEEKPEKITQEQRSPLVRDLNFGVVSGMEENKNDVPVHAKIEYNNDTNEKIYEDYTELDNILEKEFIPKKIKMKRFKTPSDIESVDFVAWIPLHEIQKLKLSEDEMKHVFEFLDERDIFVRGTNSTIDFDNYEYISTYKTLKLPEVVDWDTQLKWFEAYDELRKENKDQDAIIKARNKLVETNSRLVPFVTYKLSMKYGFDINHLNSYGYVALINAVEKFNYKPGFKFTTYAYKAILRAVLKGISNELGYKTLSQYLDVKDAVEVISEVYDEMGIEKEVAVQEIVELLRQTGYTQQTAEDITLTFIGNEDLGNEKYFEEDDEKYVPYTDEENFEIPTSISEQELIIFEENLEDSVLISESTDAIRKALLTLRPREKLVIEKRFGFNDGRPRTLSEVAKEINVTREMVRQIEHKALWKLRHPIRSKQLKGFLEAFDDVNIGNGKKIG